MKAKKTKYRQFRFRKNDPEHNLLVAASQYIRAKGGSPLVIGGIQIQKWPGSLAYTYVLGVRFTGHAPERSVNPAPAKE